jgi:hypothetical protein
MSEDGTFIEKGSAESNDDHFVINLEDFACNALSDESMYRQLTSPHGSQSQSMAQQESYERKHSLKERLWLQQQDDDAIEGLRPQWSPTVWRKWSANWNQGAATATEDGHQPKQEADALAGEEARSDDGTDADMPDLIPIKDSFSDWCSDTDDAASSPRADPGHFIINDRHEDLSLHGLGPMPPGLGMRGLPALADARCYIASNQDGELWWYKLKPLDSWDSPDGQVYAPEPQCPVRPSELLLVQDPAAEGVQVCLAGAHPLPGQGLPAGCVPPPTTPEAYNPYVHGGSYLDSASGPFSGESAGAEWPGLDQEPRRDPPCRWVGEGGASEPEQATSWNVLRKAASLLTRGRQPGRTAGLASLDKGKAGSSRRGAACVADAADVEGDGHMAIMGHHGAHHAGMMRAAPALRQLSTAMALHMRQE